MKMQRLLLIGFLFILAPVAIAQNINRETLLEDAAFLASDELEGRKPLSKGNLMARAMIRDRFKTQGLTSQYKDYIQYFSFYNKRGKEQIDNAANIVGFIPGRESANIIVVLAHYDHLGKTEDKIFNGADDNASGTAALLALAAYFSQNKPKNSMMFVALDAEEMGLQGARALVQDFPFPMEQVKLCINMDMISRSAEKELYAVGTHHYPQLKPLLEETAKNQPIKLLFGHDIPGTGSNDWTNASDHAVFHQAGIPFVYFGVEDHEDYHKETDTFENMDKDFYFHAVNLILESTRELDEWLE